MSDLGDAAADRELLQELAARVQHRLNNPLAALLAEAQLLAMDPHLREDQREAVERVIELIRRLIGIVRGLDEDRDIAPPTA